MISLMETQKLSHCIGRTVVRLLWEPRTLVECSHRGPRRGPRRVIYGTIIAFELQQLIWIKVLWLTQRGREPTIDLLAALYHFPPVASIQAAQLYITQP